MLEKLKGFLSGKKTYLIASLALVGVILQAQGIVIPEIVWQLLAIAGLGAVRAALKKLEV